MSSNDDDITIPPEAVGAAKREVAATVYRLVEPDTRAHELTENEVSEIAAAALRAGIAAWPENIHYRGGWEPVINNYQRKPHLILPLPQKARDE